MSNAAKHRKRAAEFEQLKQIDRAIASYVRAIEESEASGEDVDVALLNKVGDLALRQGRVPDAVTYYERAIEHYATSGLFNNAIALCNKVVRSAPGRSNVYFTLGRICARKGLRGDATRNFLEYATRMQSDGRIDEGMRALAEVADLMPELTEVRRLVEEHANRAGIVLPRRKTPPGPLEPVAEDAATSRFAKSQDLVFLDVDYDQPERQSAAEKARPAAADQRPPLPPVIVEAKKSRPPTIPSLRAIESALLFDPHTELVSDEELYPLAETGSEAGVTLDLSELPVMPELTEQNPLLEDFLLPPDAPSAREARLGEMEIELPNLAGDVEWIVAPVPEAAFTPDALPTREGVDAGNDVDSGGAPGRHDLTPRDELSRVNAGPSRLPFRLDPHNFILVGELPPLLLDDALVFAGLAPLTTRPGSQSIGVADVEIDEEDHLDGEFEDVDADGSDRLPFASSSAVRVTPSLPIAAVAAEAAAVATSRRDALRSQVGQAPRDWFLRRRLAEALFEAGERDAALDELETAVAGFQTDGEVGAANETVDMLVLVSPDRVPYHQKRVELAVRADDQLRLRLAYVDLADALARVGEDNRARAVYARVLEIDPWDDRARAALGDAAPPLPTSHGSDSDFVDLADFLKQGESPATTRMRMREPTVSGDEQADFDALLRHFKEGVARSLSEDDFESHYDLGVAYKEMGLLDDAIGEFQKALRSANHRLPAYEALGQCFVEQERHHVAATVLSRALHEPGLHDEQRVGVLYLLAYSCEALQRWDEARSYYQRVYATDINFRDAAARLAALEQVGR